MKKSDFVTMIGVAFSTAALTVCSFWAAPLEAGGGGEQLVPEIPQPKLAVKGVALTLSKNPTTTQSDEEPVLELLAVNTLTNRADIKVHLSMTATSPADAMSRVVRIPAKLWEWDQSIVLNGAERKTLTLTTGTRLPAGNMISVTLSETASPSIVSPIGEVLASIRPNNMAQPGIAVLTFSTGKPAQNLAQAQLSN